MALTMEITFPRRRATIKLSKYHAKQYDLNEGPIPCHVLGVYQYTDGESSEPVFVCELDSGHVVSSSVERVKFVDTDEMGVIR